MVCPKTTHLVIHYALIIGAAVMEDTNQSWLIKKDLQSVYSYEETNLSSQIIHQASSALCTASATAPTSKHHIHFARNQIYDAQSSPEATMSGF